MIFTFNKSTREIKPQQETNFKTHNILERQHIEKWIENYPEILGEDLLILTTEFDKFDKTNERLDLLAIDKNGELVVIELKRDDSGKYVDLQSLKYAAYCSTLDLDDISEIHHNYLLSNGQNIKEADAKDKIISFIENSEFEKLNDKPRVIIAAKEFRPETTASVLWFRKFDIDIKCVKIIPYELTDRDLALETSVIIPLPDAEEYLIKSEKKSNVKKSLTVSQEQYIKFHKEIIKRIENKVNTQLPDPLPRSYYQVQTGIPGVHFEWGFHGRPRNGFSVDLHFEKGNSAFNKSSVKQLKSFKTEIEKETGEEVVFQEQWGKRWSKIYIEKNEGSMTNELMNWCVQTLLILIKILQPELDKLS